MSFTRRRFFAAWAPAAALACRRRRPTGYAGYCLVANQDGRSLAAIDLSDFRLVGSTPLEAAPSMVVAHPRLPLVFVLLPETGVVLEVDAVSRSVRRRAKAGSLAATMRLSPNGDVLWVLYREPAVLVELPLDRFQPRRRVALPTPPTDFDLSPDGRAAISAGSVIIASLDHASVEHSVAIPSAPNAVSFQQKGAQVLVGCAADRTLTMIDTLTGRILARLPLALAPRRFCSVDEGTVLVSGEGKDAVVIVYPYQTEVGETILAGGAPEQMAVVPAQGGTRYLLVTNPGTSRVTVLDVDTRKLMAVVNVGREPRAIITTPDNQYALVLNEKSGDVAVIRISSLAARRYKSAPLFTLIPVGQKPVSAAVVTLT
jgi:YVTN family beta-propeller protein